MKIWEKIASIAEGIQFPDHRTNEVFHTSVEYGVRLFCMICEGWRILLNDMDSLSVYQQARDAYYRLPDECPYCASLYQSDRRVKDYKDEETMDDCMRDNDVVSNALGFDHYVCSHLNSSLTSH